MEEEGTFGEKLKLSRPWEKVCKFVLQLGSQVLPLKVGEVSGVGSQIPPGSRLSVPFARGGSSVPPCPPVCGIVSVSLREVSGPIRPCTSFSSSEACPRPYPHPHPSSPPFTRSRFFVTLLHSPCGPTPSPLAVSSSLTQTAPIPGRVRLPRKRVPVLDPTGTDSSKLP